MSSAIFSKKDNSVTHILNGLDADFDALCDSAWTAFRTKDYQPQTSNEDSASMAFAPWMMTQLSKALERKMGSLLASGEKLDTVGQPQQSVLVIHEHKSAAVSASMESSVRMDDGLLEVQNRPSKHRRNKSSVSDLSSECRSIISDHPMDEDECKNYLDTFVRSLDDTGRREHVRAILDTGHTASASLISEAVARDLGWDPENNPLHAAKGDPVTGLNRSYVETLGKFKGVVEFRVHGKVIKTIDIMFHVVPNSALEEDCLLNLKLITRQPILVLYWLSTIPAYRNFLSSFWPELLEAA